MASHEVTVKNMNRSSVASIGLSAVATSETVFGAHMLPHRFELVSKVLLLLRQLDALEWDSASAEHRAIGCAEATRLGSSARAVDIMIAAHALALGRALVTSDQAIHSLGIKGIEIADCLKQFRLVPL